MITTGINSTTTSTTTQLSTTTTNASIILSTMDPILSKRCDSEGPCKGCHYSLGVPAYLPKVIGCSLAALIAVIIFILYLIEERRKEKMFCTSSKKVEENEQEKNDRDAIAFGTNNVSYVVEQSVCGTPNSQGGGGFKVLEKKPKPKFALAPPITPFSTNVSKHSRVKTAKKEEKEVFQMSIIADKLGRGPELVSLVNETEIPVGHTTNDEKAQFAVETIKGHLEKMTEEKFVIYGYLEEKNWIFAGAEHTLGEFSELRLELKIMLTSPINLQVSAFLVKGDGNVKTTLFTPTIPPVPKNEPKEMEKSSRNSVKKPLVTLMNPTPKEETSPTKSNKKVMKQDSPDRRRSKEKDTKSSKMQRTTQKKEKVVAVVGSDSKCAPPKQTPTHSSPNSSRRTSAIVGELNPAILKKKMKELKRDDDSKFTTPNKTDTGSVSTKNPKTNP